MANRKGSSIHPQNTLYESVHNKQTRLPQTPPTAHPFYTRKHHPQCLFTSQEKKPEI